METINLSLKEFSKLKKIKPEYIREADLYKLNKKELFKCFLTLEKIEKETSDTFYKNKIKNIETLIEYKKILETLNELVLPNKLVTLDNTKAGFTMDYIHGNSLHNILSDTKISWKTKIYYLIQIGELLQKLKKLNFPYEIHINDLHEDNIIINKNKQIKIIDIDSIYISNNVPFCSQYLFCNPIIFNDCFEKYKTNKDGFVIPTENSDIYCYIIIILNTLMGKYSHQIKLSTFNDYLNYLEELNLPYNFINCISKIYTKEDNENPLPYLYNLETKNLKNAHYKIYRQKTGKILY